MIKTPVTHNHKDLTISDISGFNLAFFVDTKSGNELAKRINLHGDLVNTVKELVGVINALVDGDDSCDVVVSDWIIDSAKSRANDLLTKAL